ncbi:MAG TPA: hypothetical protein VIV35_03450 [Chitinophagaceae bacterium]
MIRYSFLILISVLFFACGNNKTDEQVLVEDSAFNKYSWEATDTGRIVLMKKEGIGPDTLSPEGVVDFLNNNFPNVQLAIVKTSGDTLFLKIPQSTYLTQRMGSSGPESYFAEAVYNLTEIPGIHYVRFDFEEGDHAQPGTFNRESFKDE